MKSSNLTHCRVHSWKKGLSEYQRRASKLQTRPSPAGGREMGGRQPELERGNLSYREAYSMKLRSGSQLLTKSCWDPGRLKSSRRVAARDQLPRGDTQHTWDGAPAAHLGNRGAGTGEVIRCTTPPGENVLTKHLVAWAAWTWEGHKTHIQSSLHFCGVPENLNLSRLDLGSTCKPGPTLA